MGVQGYETGRLIAVTPFVAKILEGAPSGNSRVFKPPNPWIMGLFSALHEVRCVVWFDWFGLIGRLAVFAREGLALVLVAG